jgi:hypothetical protein
VYLPVVLEIGLVTRIIEDISIDISTNYNLE